MKHLSAKSPTVVLFPIVAGAILIFSAVLLRYRSRFDADLWVWAAVLILIIMAISIPLAIRQQKASAAGKFLRPPWPTPATIREAVSARPAPKEIFLRGRFTWAAPEFIRMRDTWLRHTPAGKSHRRTTYGLSAIGFGGMAAACVWLAQGLLPASVLLIASVALLALVFSCRISVPDEVRSSARVSWELIPDGILLQTEDSKKELPWGSMYAILRTRDGFLLWPGDLHETWLPVRAFDRPEDVEVFSNIARSRVRNYVHQN
jgi:hypothetical protein